MSYNFSQLNDKEFEYLAIDLLSTALGKRIERFKPGKDGGVDGRFYVDNEEEVILQCKHYLKSGYSKLISKLKSEEVENVKKLKPNKYIFVTSLPLSRNNKKEIRKIFSPFIHLDNDIYGKEDLNDLLSVYPKIEEKHFKLWISSTTVLSRIINNAIKGRSEFEIEHIRNRSKKYVYTANHVEALNILKKNNVLIISGEPGIGKTILAENLSLYYVSKDYEFIDIEESLSEAESVYRRGKKQLFYFDDFLGSNYFEAIENKKDSHIVKFINRVKNDKTKIFILTTRTNILNSGILYSSIFSINKIQNNEFILTIEKLNKLDRAKILYNHIWFSKLNEDYIDKIYEQKRYKLIIKHKNFNPRLIEFITDSERISVQAKEYWDYINATLEDPKDIWDYCFKNQNNAYVRNLVNLTVFNGGQISEEELQRSYIDIIKIEGLVNNTHTEKDFNSISQLAVNSFLSRNKTSSEIIYYLFNPSIADFIINKYNKDKNKLTNIFKSLYSIKSLEQLVSLEKLEIIQKEIFKEILEKLFLYAFEKNKDLNYSIYISYFFYRDNEKKDKIILILDNFLKSPISIKEFTRLLNLLIIFKNELKIENFNFLIKTIKNRRLEEMEINALMEFFNNFDVQNQVILDVIYEELEYFVSDLANDIANEMDLDPYIEFYKNYDGDRDYELDTTAIERYIKDALSVYIHENNPKIIDKFNIDIDDIINQIDFNDNAEAYINSIQDDHDDYYAGYGGGSNSFGNAIDDLFERT
jgi:hypothetical protein